MSDQITAAVVQPNAGSTAPDSFFVTYTFDNGSGTISGPQTFEQEAATDDTLTAIGPETMATLNAHAYNAKQAWIASLAIPAQVPLPALVGPVTLVAAQ